jgi:hypothetical protein
LTSLARLLSLAAVAAVLTGALVLPAPGALAAAPAGQFSVEACTPAVGYENQSWQFTTNNPSYIEAHSTCGEPPLSGDPPTLANLALGDTLGSFGVPVGASGNWTFEAPEGTSIAEVSGSDTLMKVGGNHGWNVDLQSEGSEGHTTLAQTCATSPAENECAVGGPFQITGLDARTVTIGAECDAEEYAPGKTYTTCARGNEFGHAARAGLNYVTVTLNDTTPPADVTGSNIPTESQHGNVTIDGSATDTIAGLLTLTAINSEGHPIGASVSVGECNYALLIPCPTDASNLPLPIDTEKLPEGKDQIRVLATNAAHDQATSPTYNLAVANTPYSGQPPAPTNGNGTGSQTTTSTTTVTTSQHLGTATTPTTSPDHTSTTTSNAPSRHLEIKLVTARLRHGRLILQGTLAPDISGLLKVTISGDLRNGRGWRATTQTRLTNGRFSTALRVPTRPLKRHVAIEAVFLGSPGNVSARLRATVALGLSD